MPVPESLSSFTEDLDEVERRDKHVFWKIKHLEENSFQTILVLYDFHEFGISVNPDSFFFQHVLYFLKYGIIIEGVLINEWKVPIHEILLVLIVALFHMAFYCRYGENNLFWFDSSL